LYNVVSALAPIYADPVVASTYHFYSGNYKLQKRECRTSLTANVFGFRLVNFWNSMPEEIVAAPPVNSFKGRFDKKYAHLRYCTDMDYVSTSEDRSTGLLA